MVYFYRLGRTLIDAGSPNQAACVADYARQHRIQRLLCTHHHEDHAGNGALLQRNGVQVSAPAASQAYLRDGYPQEWYRRIIWGKAQPFTPDHTLEEVTEVPEIGARLRLIQTPGHSPDHSCFLEEERGWLFGSDIFVTRSPKLMRFDEDPNEAIKSFERVLQYEFDTLFCAHRGVLQNGKQPIRERLEHMLSIRQQVEGCREAGMSLHETRDHILGKEGWFARFTQNDFSKLNLIRGFYDRPSQPCC
eukprot:CAMPEP_0174238200 /NCGR_PEP_ID=MMETSP0417-20130205/10474_1 /TAXON_ID=242541 /ORGANISM="Mayorella sp, Strain BSH-02190019" /LENGTH=247 /DNA_ID=CAMNT_0015317017 /DNA_START=31 /DNA_END=774 /DNA_ORIENTATION=-